jgi:hypothetical protein
MECKTYFDDVAAKWDDMRTGFFSESIRKKRLSLRISVKAGSVPMSEPYRLYY